MFYEKLDFDGPNFGQIPQSSLIQAYDYSGRRIFETDVRNPKPGLAPRSSVKVEIDISMHSKGIYFMQMLTENSPYAVKIILE